ncbi:hypothetical protein [Neisseria subflava]|uniref:hypothetical protein n=1 Tax=Neisseria subflava TaxID=28449 RepID=UPI00202AAEE1|nr:hypothetical protein [Neisseria subflava]
MSVSQGKKPSERQISGGFAFWVGGMMDIINSKEEVLDFVRKNPGCTLSSISDEVLVSGVGAAGFWRGTILRFYVLRVWSASVFSVGFRCFTLWKLKRRREEGWRRVFCFKAC